MICGRNRQLQERLRSRPQGPGHVVLHVCGFVDNMHEWMSACDTIITKAGPGTIAEALICGLPILLNGNVPCQVCQVLQGGREGARWGRDLALACRRLFHGQYLGQEMLSKCSSACLQFLPLLHMTLASVPYKSI